MGSNANAKDYPENSDLQEKVLNFSWQYEKLLEKVHHSLNENPGLLTTAFADILKIKHCGRRSWSNVANTRSRESGVAAIDFAAETCHDFDNA